MANDVLVSWKEGIHFEGVSGSHTVHMDGNVAAGGQGFGFSPMRLLLISLAGCTAMDVISILGKMRQDVTAFDIAVSGERAAEHPKVYTSIEVIYRLRGRGLAPDLVEKAVTLSREKYCSVQGMLRAVPISYKIEITEEQPVP